MTWLLFIWLCPNFLNWTEEGCASAPLWYGPVVLPQDRYRTKDACNGYDILTGLRGEYQVTEALYLLWKHHQNIYLYASVGDFWMCCLSLPHAWGIFVGRYPREGHIQHHRTAQGGISGDNKHLPSITGKFAQWLSGERSWFKSFTESMNLYCADMVHEISQNQVCLIYR